MHHRLAFAAVLLPLAGCVVPPPGPPVPYGYPQPGYPPAYGQQDFAYPGYSYNNGSPFYVEGGVNFPLIFYGGGWGYWDGYHRWHRAPDAVWHDLDRRHPGGAGYRPYGGGGFGGPRGLRPEGGYHPEMGRPEGARVGGYPGGNPGAGRPPGPPPGGFRGPPPAQAQRAAAPAPRPPPPQRHREDDHDHH
jgi:hypothetical protein